jgi:hypothetical protein
MGTKNWNHWRRCSWWTVEIKMIGPIPLVGRTHLRTLVGLAPILWRRWRGIQNSGQQTNWEMSEGVGVTATASLNATVEGRNFSINPTTRLSRSNDPSDWTFAYLWREGASKMVGEAPEGSVAQIGILDWTQPRWQLNRMSSALMKRASRNSCSLHPNEMELLDFLN